MVVGDSFTFTDDRGPVMPGAGTVWPTVAAAAVGEVLGVAVETQVVSAPARTVREALELVRKDRHVQFEVLARADAVVLALGSYDHAPIGVPAPVFALASFLRPPGLRRSVRRALHRAYPWLVRATGGRASRTPWSGFERDWEALLTHVRGVAHGAAGAVVGPSTHRAAYYGHTHPRYPQRASRQLAAAARQGFTTVDPHPLVVAGGEPRNPDGIHWHRAAHERVGRAVAAALVAQLAGAEPRPPRPGRDEG